MQAIPHAADILYTALPGESKEVVRKMVRIISKKAQIGRGMVTIRIGGTGISIHAIGRVFTMRGYRVKISDNNDGTHNISLDWRCG